MWKSVTGRSQTCAAGLMICRLNLQPNIQPSHADFHLPFNQDTWDWNLCWGMRKRFCVQKHESVGRDISQTVVTSGYHLWRCIENKQKNSKPTPQSAAPLQSCKETQAGNTKTPYGRTRKQIMTSRAVCTLSSLILSLKLSFCFYPSSHYFHKYSCDHPSASWIQSWILMFSYVTSITLKPHRYQNSVRRRL